MESDIYISFNYTLSEAKVSQIDLCIHHMYKLCILLHTFLGLVFCQNVNGDVKVIHVHHSYYWSGVNSVVDDENVCRITH